MDGLASRKDGLASAAVVFAIGVVIVLIVPIPKRLLPLLLRTLPRVIGIFPEEEVLLTLWEVDPPLLAPKMCGCGVVAGGIKQSVS